MPNAPLLPIFRLAPSRELRFVPIRRIDPVAGTLPRHRLLGLQRGWWQLQAPRTHSNQMPS